MKTQRRAPFLYSFCISSCSVDPSALAVAELRNALARRSRPLDGILDHFQNIGVEIGGKCFMAGAEIDDFSGAARPRASAAKDFAAAEAADQKNSLGLGDVEELAVHFLVIEDEMIVDSLRDGMAGTGDPQNFALGRILAPFQIATRAHQFFEDLGKMSAVQHQQAHAVLSNTIADAIDHGIGNVAVSGVAPPGE